MNDFHRQLRTKPSARLREKDMLHAMDQTRQCSNKRTGLDKNNKRLLKGSSKKYICEEEKILSLDVKEMMYIYCNHEYS